jgi:hypothetical protein
MKKIILIGLLTIAPFLSRIAFSQAANKPLFDSTWYGFKTGAYADGQSPSAVKSADMDNDGDADIVVSQENFSNGFVYLKNKKKGMYGEPVKYKSKNASKDIVAADFNNDGFKDVALTNTGVNFEGNSVSVFINKGGGAFKKEVTYLVRVIACRNCGC